MALRVSCTGPAASWARLDGLAEAGIEVVTSRTAVVLVLVDGMVQPTDTDRDLVRAVSGATGRCAVGLCQVAGSHAGELSAQWRAAVPAHIPVCPLSGDSADAARLADELSLVADGPARPVSPTPVEQRRMMLAGQLSRERAGRAELMAQQSRRRRAEIPQAIVESLESIAPQPEQVSSATELLYAAEDAAEDLADRLGVPPPPCPDPPAPPATAQPADIAVGLLTFGAAVGVGRLLETPARHLGVSATVAGWLALMVGLGVAAVVIISHQRTRRSAARTRWVAGYVVTLRRLWERDVASAPEPERHSWRQEQLAAALGAVPAGRAPERDNS
ncbi:hypothetical protein KRX51_09045 [Corynebacterium sp. TAE3-ERU12]|uniref:hypothetical protein n=1 Tax=Corynebacterium sp. TAE3-ERU12 TaxID=2849491 RepID=UPI001C45DA6F|nr:hypothetical protein [Corynebacterium sp. TAE3-ERU12]MBV7296054.1 hypothetical protein [Corynebacterium sp. TAE3-ERU12]